MRSLAFKKIEYILSHFPIWLIAYPRTCIVSVLLFAALLVAYMGQIHFETSLDKFLDENNPERVAYLEFKESFGQSEYFILLIQDDNIFSKDVIAKIRALSADIDANVPYIANVETIENATYASGSNDEIHLSTLFDDDLNVVDYDAVQKIATTTPYYVNRLINRSGDATAVIVRMHALMHDPETNSIQPMYLGEGIEALNAIREVVSKHNSEFDQEILIGGTPMATVELTLATKRDILVFTLSSMAVVCVFLFLFFRTMSAVFLPMISLMLAVSVTMSLMIIGKYPIQVTSSILPSFLLAVCVGDAVHMLKAFYDKFNLGMEKQAAIDYAIRHTSVAMFFTTLTTSVGLLSFSTSDIAPIASFGIFSAVGVWVALILTVIFMPALMRVIPMRPYTHQRIVTTVQVNAVGQYIDFIRHHAGAIVFGACALMVLCVVLSFKLALSHDVIGWLKPENPIRQAVETIDDRLTGTMQVELVVSRDDHQSLSPHQLQALDLWISEVSRQPIGGVEIRSVSSVMDLIKQVNGILTGEENSLPNEADLLAQEMLILELDSADLIASLTNGGLQEIRITLTTPWQDAVHYTDFLHMLDKQFKQNFQDGLQLKITGMASIVNRTFYEMLNSMPVSYVFAALLVTMLMVILMSSVRLGLAMMLPNLLPIFGVLAVMYWFNLPLDIFSMLIGSIAIGLIVDDSIHFIYTYQRYYQQLEEVRESLIQTIITTGRALLTTTVVLCLGFTIYTLSELSNLAAFGVLTALCIFFALIADILLAPAIIILLYERRYAAEKVTFAESR
ncbi:Uncharacterised protein [BD1-7 clade bacterium]|uniref:SSD domain-containing protein n=1 Tax=BD1-7 clade bacterium TaxID=2029982 RepID=A0A5S9PEU9_9GAMM|nr:Uncharacterised protein [BD1-7 clade bacterium]CAA0102390.1 Uncharacterised protein [BD1-7 clade bacterium]